MATSRDEHMEWCKTRALEYVDRGDTDGAFASMASDLQKHPETSDHLEMQLGLMMKMSGHLDSLPEMRRWIVGFN